jgi:hypothetical protein
MLLLQLEMLAYVENEVSAPTLVIGAGVPADWLGGPLSIAGIGTAAGLVDWRWAAGKVTVTLHGPHLPVRLGPGFPRAAAIEIVDDFPQDPRKVHTAAGHSPRMHW